jgi:hypothetical protein
LFTRGQLQALRPNAPLLSREPGSGQFKLTLGLAKSTSLEDFDPMPIAPSGVSFTPEGKIEYRFSSPEPAAFFRVEGGP